MWRWWRCSPQRVLVKLWSLGALHRAGPTESGVSLVSLSCSLLERDREHYGLGSAYLASWRFNVSKHRV